MPADSPNGEAMLVKLEDRQLESFDEDYVRDDMWEDVQRLLDEAFPDGNFSMVDIGGGNGHFADQVLERYPKATCKLIDNAEVLLERNRPHPRKTLVCDSVENLPTALAGESYDLLCMHWILHHLLVESYSGTRDYQRETLVEVQRYLAPGGRISVFENLYDGWLVDRAPGWLIHRLTSSRTLGRMTRLLGANTGGVGVCFASEAEWRAAFARANLTVASSQRYPDSLDVNPLYRALLHVPRPQVGHFWLEPQRVEPQPG